MMAESTSLVARILKALRLARTPIARSESRRGQVVTGEILPVLVVVEGGNDIQFLRRAAAILRTADRHLPDIGHLERTGRIVFVPFGGDVRSWAFRLAELRSPEFHLYDREDLPAAQIRHEVARTVNLRTGCRAAVTSKRSLENFLHPAAIFEARGIEVNIGDDDDVADLVAERWFLRQHPADRWKELPARSRRRLRNKAKHWLNTVAVERMSVERFADRDPVGEINGWLRIIAEMVSEPV
jgi:hypothetical protein